MFDQNRLLLLFASTSTLLPTIWAAATLDDVFRVATGKIDGSCDAYRRSGGNGLLEDMFEEMQAINANAVEALKLEPRSSSDEAKGLLRSFFGVNRNDDSNEEEKKLDNDKVVQIK